ncbi:4Fe-4S ferredoxin iron-sulfur binding domain protein [Sulfuricella denitrificans skB26]|uniref:4Fe-4S ferredoxin iron-sulfur binding domain protein n=2 Tax=Sulfuricella denitrificans TaxID=649841 RepID=S6AJ76_SULDS|nr:4Fe-4S ferredoxin iron-sulfur binding domain protein [Sulfuricella denitrificans skB26]
MFKSIFPTLGRFRLFIQIFMLLLTVYGSNVVGFYMAEKISNALPALSCAFDQQNGSYCVLIPTQHQLHHRVGEALIKAQQFTFQMVLPLLFTLLTFFTFFVVLNKAFCGWICPLGTIQELINKLGRRLNLPLRRFENGSVSKVRPVKWLMLIVLVLALPLLAGLGVTPHATGDAYCQVCPSRLATTLLTANTEQMAIRTGSTLDFAFGAIANTLFGFMLVAALAVRQPFCRICPMLSFNATFQRLSPMRLVKKQHDKCDKCGICAKACPMDIHEIAREHGTKAFHEDCTLCGRCVEFCPDDGVIQMKWGPLTLFGSSREYYKLRMKGEMPDGTVKIVAAPRKSGQEAERA